MIFSAIICHFKGHNIEPNESIVRDTMLDKRDWLCRCHRCGLYVMHDGAISNMTLTLTKRDAYRIKKEFEDEFRRLIQNE